MDKPDKSKTEHAVDKFNECAMTFHMNRKEKIKFIRANWEKLEPRYQAEVNDFMKKQLEVDLENVALLSHQKMNPLYIFSHSVINLLFSLISQKLANV